MQPRRQHWFLNEKSGFPFRTPAFCSVSRGQTRLGEKEYRAPSVTPGVALRPRTQGSSDASSRPIWAWIQQQIPRWLEFDRQGTHSKPKATRILVSPRSNDIGSPNRIYKSPRGLNDISVLSKYCYGRSLRRDKSFIWRMSGSAGAHEVAGVSH